MIVESDRLLAACCGAHAQSSSTSAQSFPNQPVRIIVPFSAGSITDGLARVLAEKLGEIWRQTVIVENRPGLAGTAAAANAQPDGYTLMLTSSGHAIAGVLNKTLPFDPVTSFSGVTQVASVPLVMVVPPDLSAKTLGEFIALAKEKPGALNFSSAGLASMSYLSGEVFKQAGQRGQVNAGHQDVKRSRISPHKEDRFCRTRTF